MSIRPVKRILQAQPTMEGAGVRLRRAFGFGDTKEFDPFLLFDDFRNENPEDYLAGFPGTPIGESKPSPTSSRDGQPRRQPRKQGRARGGRRAVDDRGQRNPPSGDAERGPAWSHARVSAVGEFAVLPEDDPAALPGHLGRRHPEVTDDDGTRVRVICGTFWGKAGPVEGVAADPRYLDVWVPPGKGKSLPVETTGHAFAYVFEGSGTFRDASEPGAVRTERVGPVVAGESGSGGEAQNRSLVLFDSGDAVTVKAGDAGIRFLLVSGKPIEEPVAWYGPIVMNTPDELRRAYAELQDGTFIKQR